MNHRPDAIVFDLDGVIVDSEPLHAEALAGVCKPHGVAFDGARFVGWPDAAALRQAFSDAGRQAPEPLVAELLDRKNRRLLDSLRVGRIRPYPGVVDLIRALCAARVPLALCSAALRREIEPTLETLGLTDAFKTVVGCEDAARTKPHPDPYLLAAERLGVAPARSIAIEDSAHGVASASDAGFVVFALGHTTRPELLARASHWRSTIAALSPELIALAELGQPTSTRP